MPAGYGEELDMTQQIIQDWINSEINLGYGNARDIRYRVFREGEEVFQEICDTDGSPIHVFVLPEGLALTQSSYEVMARYVLADVVNS